MWKKISDEIDLKNLMDSFGNFHDSCLKEMSFSTGAFVDTDLSMAMVNNPQARFVFQRQSENPSTIEIVFKNVTRINIRPPEINNTPEIFCAKIVKHDDIYYWAENDTWSIGGENRDDFTWISATELSWREREDLLGK